MQPTLDQLREVAELTAEAVVRRLSPRGPTLAETERLVTAWLATRRTENTRRVYEQALRDYAGWDGLPTAAAVVRLLGLSRGQARLHALEWQADMRGRDLAPSTINTRSAALCSLTVFASEADAIAWTLRLPQEPPELRRDVRGPGPAGWAAVLRGIDALGGNMALRTRALARLLHDLALRVTEALTLDVEHVDVGESALLVLRKGRRERVRLALPPPTRLALEAWLHARGDDAGPVFCSLSSSGVPRRPFRRLPRENAAALLRRIGVRVGLERPVRPHGLRHEGITRALDATGGDVRKVMRFSGHAKPETVIRVYDDRRGDCAGDVARLVAGEG
ncbi:MAG: tyrosine-type recombinase/integrase [Planctomycetes bacterium]|nr:tyrosine-type recombinase/integrase [Planctomycetota bacterium]